MRNDGGGLGNVGGVLGDGGRLFGECKWGVRVTYRACAGRSRRGNRVAQPRGGLRSRRSCRGYASSICHLVSTFGKSVHK